MKPHSKSKKRSSVWNFFEEIGDNKARCNTCARVLSFKGGNAFNLTRHSMRCHDNDKDLNLAECSDITLPESDIKATQSNGSYGNMEYILIKEQNKDETKHAIKKRKRSGGAWNYFDKVERDKYKCTICSKSISVKNGNNHNLVRHLNVHKDMHDVDLGPVQSDELESTAAWKYFKKIGTDKAKCSSCSEVVSITNKNEDKMSQHIRNVHNIEIVNLDFIGNSSFDNYTEPFMAEPDVESLDYKVYEDDYSIERSDSEPDKAKICSQKTGKSAKSKTEVKQKLQEVDLDDQLLRAIAAKLNQPETNVYSSFGQYVADQLKMMTPKMAILCKKVINDAIYEGDLGNLTEHTKVKNKPQPQLQQRYSQTE